MLKFIFLVSIHLWYKKVFEFPKSLIDSWWYRINRSKVPYVIMQIIFSIVISIKLCHDKIIFQFKPCNKPSTKLRNSLEEHENFHIQPGHYCAECISVLSWTMLRTMDLRLNCLQHDWTWSSRGALGKLLHNGCLCWQQFWELKNNLLFAQKTVDLSCNEIVLKNCAQKFKQEFAWINSEYFELSSYKNLIRSSLLFAVSPYEHG